jgi:hypothetical protein
VVSHYQIFTFVIAVVRKIEGAWHYCLRKDLLYQAVTDEYEAMME